ncbi:MAG TPA: cytochrome c maturation protein CcmE [Gammaproteobacteria bacterium]|nr:cytochrome c maturation protein CcmE [Gammaproteobacteria bacterium]
MTRRQNRMLFVAIVVAGVALAAALALRAFQENILYYYLPSQVMAGEAPPEAKIRLGGVVAKNSVRRVPGSLTVSFGVTDGTAQIPVVYTGVLPDLFREGQGIVAIGTMQAGTLRAEDVLAKHDENYMPPKVAKAMKQAEKNNTDSATDETAAPMSTTADDNQ